MCPIAISVGDEAQWRPLRHCELTPDDITPEWMDLLVKRLLRELDRQIRQIEGAKAPETGQERAANARALVSLDRALASLLRMESDRAARREAGPATNQDEAFEAFKRRLDQLALGQRAQAGD